jgi:hypothetical protein
MRAQDNGVERLIAVGFGEGNIILELSRYGFEECV